MNSIRIIPLISMLILLLTASAITAQQQQIRSLLEERDRKIKELVGPEDTELTDSQRRELRLIINDMMDFREIARFALADKFDALGSDDQEEFIDLFSKIIRDQSLRQLDIYRAEVIYENIEVKNNQALVTTTAVLEEKRIPVKYRMLRKDDEWVFTDMAVDDVWTAESYRRSFQNIIRRRGYDTLIQNLRKRVDEIQT